MSKKIYFILILTFAIALASCKKRDNSFYGTVKYLKKGDTTGTLRIAKNAEIVILNHAGGSPEALYTIYSDEEGNYEVTDVAPRYYDLAAKYPKDSSFYYYSYYELIYLDRGEDREINLVLK